MTAPYQRKIWSRLVEMSWDELRTRAGQAAAKRIDLARYRLGLGPGTSAVRGDVTTRPRFFFSPGELPGRIEILREHLPQTVADILLQADEVCQHRFRLLGYTDLDYGREVDWHRDAVSGKRAPLAPWFKIRFLDSGEVGDHKVTWELNRHQHLVTLAKAWQLTRDSRYASEIGSQLESWWRANPYPLGINWASSLEVAFRSLSWLWVRELLAGCEALPAALWNQLLRGLALNGRHIERYLSTYFSPNTHLIGEAVALFFIGTLCPQVSAAQRWQRRGWDILLAETSRQVRVDGVYFEQSLYYHVYALDFFLHARQLAAVNGVEVPASFDQTLMKMLSVIQALSQGGIAEGFGDDDGGRVFDPRRNRSGHMQDPLVLGAGIFGDLESPALTEEAVWLLGLDGISEAVVSPARGLQSRAFDAGGIHVLADAEPLAQCFMIDAGPQGTGRSGHGHADALSVRLSMGGRRCLIDSGTCTYSDGGDRVLFRGTGAHNTLRVDGQDQAVAEGLFAWSSIPSVVVERWIQGSTFTLFTGSHNGYARLEDPVRHRRFVLHLQGTPPGSHCFWLVRDVVEGRKAHDLEILWHFASDLMVTKDGRGFVARRLEPRPTDIGTDRAQLLLLPAFDSGWRHELTSADVSPAYGTREQGPLVRSTARVELPAECATLLMPDAAPSGCEELERVGADQSVVSSYCCSAGGASHYFFFAEAGSNWRAGPWSSDAKVLYCRLENGRLAHVVLCAGSFVSLRDKTAVRHKRMVERFELIKEEGICRCIFSSDPLAIDSVADESAVFE